MDIYHNINKMQDKISQEFEKQLVETVQALAALKDMRQAANCSILCQTVFPCSLQCTVTRYDQLC